ncbi:MAG: hypothetical protein V7631_3050 [Massilia sp.]|jgi:hypothetical protein
MEMEHGKEYVGTVFVLPESRAFELKTTMNGVPVTLHGTVAQHLAEQFAGHLPDEPFIDVRQLAMQPRRVEVLTRDIHERHRAPRKVHFLMRVLDSGVQAERPSASVTT